MLAPPGEANAIETEDHPHQRLDPTDKPRACAREHIQILMEHLKRLGHDPAIDVPDDAFSELEHVQRRAPSTERPEVKDAPLRGLNNNVTALRANNGNC